MAPSVYSLQFLTTQTKLWRLQIFSRRKLCYQRKIIEIHIIRTIGKICYERIHTKIQLQFVSFFRILH